MAVSLTHTTAATGVDSADGKISKNAWNEAHTLTATDGKLLGASGSTTVGEITVGSGLSLAAGTLTASAPSVAPLVLGTDLVEQRNGTNAQTFNSYNTYTDASNYERGFVRWTSNVFEVGAEAAGTGTARSIQFRSSRFSFDAASLNNHILLKTEDGFPGIWFATNADSPSYANYSFLFDGSAGTVFNAPSGQTLMFRIGNGSRWIIDSSGHFTVGADNAYDIGAPATRARNGYFKGVVCSGSTVVASLPAAATVGAGARHFVTDATATTFLSTVAGGGANKVPVVSDGTNWLIG
jgi:hypothetical protein